MRIIFIRHAEPDYSFDGLTPAGQREAELLAKRVANWKIHKAYVSPLGRAIDTAKPSLDALNIEATTIPWLREFSYHVYTPARDGVGVCWDFVPSYWVNEPKMLTMEDWLDIEPACQNETLKEQYYVVTKGIDDLLLEYGYERCGNYYKNLNPKNRRYSSTVLDPAHHLANTMPQEDADPVIVMFCHFGVTCLIMSHLLNIPFHLLTHGTIIPPTGVTILNTEERWDDEAYFRIQTLGDVTHLHMGDAPISSAGSFAPLFQG